VQRGILRVGPIRLEITAQTYPCGRMEEARAGLLQTSLMPQSIQVLDVSRAAYQTDRVDFLSLIDNQRVLLDVKALRFAPTPHSTDSCSGLLRQPVGFDAQRG